jgi:putative Mg2+ transporter-C (MgtC) family protein
LREGLNVKGLNTATIWCSGAIASLFGAGLIAQATFGTATILVAHLALRPLTQRIDTHFKRAVNVEMHYRIRVVCPRHTAPLIRTILLSHINAHSTLTARDFTTQKTEKEDEATVIVDIHSTVRNELPLEELVNRINIEPGIAPRSRERIS